jgi:hypothetical protein
MTGRIGSLGDRLLSAVVPRARASAAACGYRNRGGRPCPTGRCGVQLCCTRDGVTRCGPCLYTSVR